MDDFLGQRTEEEGSSSWEGEEEVYMSNLARQYTKPLDNLTPQAYLVEIREAVEMLLRDKRFMKNEDVEGLYLVLRDVDPTEDVVMLRDCAVETTDRAQSACFAALCVNDEKAIGTALDHIVDTDAAKDIVFLQSLELKDLWLSPSIAIDPHTGQVCPIREAARIRVNAQMGTLLRRILCASMVWTVIPTEAVGPLRDALVFLCNLMAEATDDGKHDVNPPLFIGSILQNIADIRKHIEKLHDVVDGGRLSGDLVRGICMMGKGKITNFDDRWVDSIAGLVDFLQTCEGDAISKFASTCSPADVISVASEIVTSYREARTEAAEEAARSGCDQKQVPININKIMELLHRFIMQRVQDIDESAQLDRMQRLLEDSTSI